jgi:hypothetical protein
LEEVRAEIELAVKKEKKAEILKDRLDEQLAGVSDLTQYGIDRNEDVGEATQVKFSNTYVTGIGLEPYIVGAAMHLPVDQISEPLIGESGVFVLSVTNRTEPTPDEEIDPTIKTRLKYSLESRSNFEAYNALLDAANVKDHRLDLFYN